MASVLVAWRLGGLGCRLEVLDAGGLVALLFAWIFGGLEAWWHRFSLGGLMAWRLGGLGFLYMVAYVPVDVLLVSFLSRSHMLFTTLFSSVRVQLT